MVHEDHYYDDRKSVWTSLLTVLAVALFFVLGWFANDAYQNIYQGSGGLQYGVGGAPVVPPPTNAPLNIPTMEPSPTEVPTEQPTMEPSPTNQPIAPTLIP